MSFGSIRLLTDGMLRARARSTLGTEEGLGNLLPPRMVASCTVAGGVRWSAIDLPFPQG